MAKLDKLIQEFCPDGVEYVSLETVCQIAKGVQFNKADMSNSGSYPVINGGIGPSGYIEQYNQSENTITISQGGASAGYVNWLETKFWAGAHCYVIKAKDEVLNRYAYHFIKSKERKLQECQYGAGIPALSKSTVASLRIPLPPLPVQQEIVRILDNFTQLTAELMAELTARRKQYEHYRDELLTFGNEVAHVKLETLCDIGDGLHGTPQYNERGEYYFINGNNLINGTIQFSESTKHVDEAEFKKQKIVLNNTIFMSINGTIGNVAYYNGEKVVLGKSVAYFSLISHHISKEYLYYLLQSKYANLYFEKNLTGSTIKNLGLKALREFSIPLPPLAIQIKLAKHIAVFDRLYLELCAEIQARQKQYEYYRDKLLSFKELEA